MCLGESASVVTCLDGYEMAQEGPRRPRAGHGCVSVLYRRTLA